MNKKRVYISGANTTVLLRFAKAKARLRCDDRFEWTFQQENGEYYRSRSEWKERTCLLPPNDFRLLKGVTADVKTPQILAENRHEG